ncbi:MAG: hypothetical protein HY925_00295 [Elusimicrobia bacterium]|nr:hypothetical protein [Elusimicrobiota bacterium]
MKTMIRKALMIAMAAGGTGVWASAAELPMTLGDWTYFNAGGAEYASRKAKVELSIALQTDDQTGRAVSVAAYTLRLEQFPAADPVNAKARRAGRLLVYRNRLAFCPADQQCLDGKNEIPVTLGVASKGDPARRLKVDFGGPDAADADEPKAHYHIEFGKKPETPAPNPRIDGGGIAGRAEALARGLDSMKSDVLEPAAGPVWRTPLLRHGEDRLLPLPGPATLRIRPTPAPKVIPTAPKSYEAGRKMAELAEKALITIPAQAAGNVLNFVEGASDYVGSRLRDAFGKKEVPAQFGPKASIDSAAVRRLLEKGYLPRVGVKTVDHPDGRKRMVPYDSWDPSLLGAP